MTTKKTTNLQERYQKWHLEGMDLAFEFVPACRELMTEILTLFREDSNPEVRGESKIPFENEDTFESAWIDDQGRPCCLAKIDDGAPMGWRVEFLDLHLKRELHELLQNTLHQLSIDASDRH